MLGTFEKYCQFTGFLIVKHVYSAWCSLQGKWIILLCRIPANGKSVWEFLMPSVLIGVI